jgi:hypothetical protein
MNTAINYDKLLEDLKSSDPAVLIPAMDESVEPLREFVARAAEKIEDRNYGLFVAERLYKLIATAIEEVENFFRVATDFEAKVHAGITLLLLGSKSGVPHLLEAVEYSRESGSLAAHKLANAGVTDVAGRIINRLRRQDADHPLVIISLLSALKKVLAELPPDLESFYLTENAPEEVREFIQLEWPHPASIGREMTEQSLRI